LLQVLYEVDPIVGEAEHHKLILYF
jgi:hypothetical protein